ncbi:hypothetical protein [Kribbella sp. DT2]|uniref:hypothetical protein n=1 Tax=Kribbella sp. DT2 TaxID=3393427 RepID=UPI003CF6A016
MSEAEILAAVRRILDQRLPAEETIRAIRQLVEPQRKPHPLERTEGCWPILRTSDDAWERHDDPEMS